MGKVLMKKTVFDNKSGYHKAGEIVTLSADVERHYLANNFGTKVEDQPEVIAPIVEAVEVETKEEKKRGKEKNCVARLARGQIGRLALLSFLPYLDTENFFLKFKKGK